MRPPLVAAAMLLALAGCATIGLEPARSYTVASNVRVTVQTRSWQGYPADLQRSLTPVEVTLENDSGHPLRVQYRDFTLVGSSGFRYSAIPPLATDTRRSERSTPFLEGALVLVSGEASRVASTPPPPAVGSAPGPAPIAPPPPAVGSAPGPMPLPEPRTRPVMPPPPAVGSQPGPRGAQPIRPRFSYRDFYVSPWYSPFYPGLGVWGGPSYWDPLYYDRYYSWGAQLPTRDMLEVALPEGVLQDGGKIRGFLYFPTLPREQSVTFQAELVDANSGTLLGTAGIPLVVAH